ncbi:MAG: hypothetical protein ACE3L7_32420 [Candidatus Pristimantibacillus sp.]
MVAKSETLNTQDGLGLSAKDIIYLIIFRELRIQPQVMKSLSETVVRESGNLNSTIYIYQVIREMASHNWVVQAERIGNHKIMAITDHGIKKQKELSSTYYVLLSELKDTTDYFVSELNGHPLKERPPMSDAVRKHFNRLINVRHLTRYLFLTILEKEKACTCVEIYELMQLRYGWQCGEGYIYELAHEMEHPERGWIIGRWTSDRKHSYVYRLTQEGYTWISNECKDALEPIRSLQTYTVQLLKLFPSHV